MPSYLNWPQYTAWRDAVETAQAVVNKDRPAEVGPDTQWSYDADAYRHAMLAGICGVVQGWALEGLASPVTPDTFPVRPAKAATALFDWLMAAINQLVTDAESDDPK